MLRVGAAEPDVVETPAMCARDAMSAIRARNGTSASVAGRMTTAAIGYFISRS